MDADAKPSALTEVEFEAFADSPDPVEEAQDALETLPGVTCECGSSHERRGSREPLDARMCSERIRQIQVS